MKNSLNKSQIERFSRQLILKNIGAKGQKKIFSYKILIVGVGGLGCPLLTYLAASGVGTVGIVDHDKVELSNLNGKRFLLRVTLVNLRLFKRKTILIKLIKKLKLKHLNEKYHDPILNLLLKVLILFVMARITSIQDI